VGTDDTGMTDCTEQHPAAHHDGKEGEGQEGMPIETAVTGYRPSATLPLWAEVRRQASRRRTQLALGFMAALPLIVLIAFEFGGNGTDEDPADAGPFGSLNDLATSGGLNFALFCLAVSAGFLLVVVVALFFGDTVASEASWGSLRYLLAVPVPRARLLGVKLVVAAGYSLVALILLTGVGLLAGTLRYGWNPLGSTVAAQIPPGAGLVRLLGVAAYLAVSLLVVAGLAFLASVLTDAPLGAVGGAVMVWILSSILDQVNALGDIRDVLPSHYGNAWIGLLSTPAQIDDLAKGAITAVLYATLFWCLAFWRFTKKDITS
jgi:ABC-2 type transport system permease protein